jgi:LysR family cys regulon transcriptional activator
MKLHQLRYLAAVAQTGLNITAAAEKLHTSQPGVSKQIKLLEDELGFQIFVRDGRNLSRVTPAGQQVIDRAVRILREVQNIKRLSDDLKDEERGSLAIATTHTQARYVLPEVIKAQEILDKVLPSLENARTGGFAQLLAGTRELF